MSGWERLLFLLVGLAIGAGWAVAVSWRWLHEPMCEPREICAVHQER